MKTTDAVIEVASLFVGLDKRTVCKYRKEFFTNHGRFPETKRGKYTRQCPLNNENLCLNASMWVHENAHQKGAAYMTAPSFCQWVNETLLLQHELSANLPCRISLAPSPGLPSTITQAHTWMVMNGKMSSSPGKSF